MFSRSSDKMETVIGPNVVLKGMLKSQSGVHLDGVVEGDVETTGNVIVGDKGQVTANITAQNVTISGMVKGNVTAKGRLDITAKGKMWGDVSAATLTIEEGGIFRGQSTMTHEAFQEPAKSLSEKSVA